MNIINSTWFTQLGNPGTIGVVHLANWAYRNNGEFGVKKYHFYYNQNRGKVFISNYIDTYQPSVIFSSKEVAEKCLEEFGKDFIKIACGKH